MTARDLAAPLALALLLGAPAQAATPYDAGQAVTSSSDSVLDVAAGDLDGDGDPDLVAPSSIGPLAWHANLDGAGTFGAAQTIAAGAATRSVVLADLDRDGDLDVLSGSFSGSRLGWFENSDGAGTFAAEQIISTAVVSVTAVDAADLDGDGDADAISASFGDGKIAWYANDGTGGFGSQLVVTTSGGLLESLHAADLDRDGDLDLVVAALSNRIAWYENLDGAGTFGSEQLISTAVSFAYDAIAADVDRDGDLDVVSASSGDGRIAWYENLDGAGTFGTQTTVTAAAPGARSVAAADVDGDGDLDLLVASSDDDTIGLFEGDGAGGFAARQALSSLADGASAVLAADLDTDGRIDVAGASMNDDTIAWFRNRSVYSALAFSASIALHASVGPGAKTADLDRDGDLDVLAADTGVSFWVPNADGAGSFAAAVELTNELRALFPADLDGDGDLDVLSDGEWFENSDGSGTFAAGQATGFDPELVADLDRDGDLDALSAPGTSVLLHANDGTGSFAAGVELGPLLNSVVRVIAADVDGDGDDDLLVEINDQIQLIENLGAGFAAPAFLLVKQALGAADLDGDGDVDLFGSSGTFGPVWQSNLDGAGTFGATFFIDLSSSIGLPTAADLDRDGDLDLVGSSTWHENLDGAATFSAEQPLGGTQHTLADLDRDGRLDLVSSSWRPGSAGEFALATQDIAPEFLLEGGSAAALQFDATHLGRPGDQAIELASVALELTTDGGILPGSLVDMLIDSLALYRDDGSGSFEPGSDALVASLSPVPTDTPVIALPDAHPDATLAQGTTGRFFVIVTLEPDAYSVVPRRINVIHREQASTAEETLVDGELNLSGPGYGISSGLIRTASLDDLDGDDLTNSQEALLGTDPMDPDSDDDGLDDGPEISLGTDPLDSDSDDDGLTDDVEIALGLDPLGGPFSGSQRFLTLPTTLVDQWTGFEWLVLAEIESFTSWNEVVAGPFYAAGYRHATFDHLCTLAVDPATCVFQFPLETEAINHLQPFSTAKTLWFYDENRLEPPEPGQRAVALTTVGLVVGAPILWLGPDEPVIHGHFLVRSVPVQIPGLFVPGLLALAGMLLAAFAHLRR